MGEVVIRARDLRMRYGTKDVLTGVDLDLRAGEVVCLLGPNGAGKTTTIEILEGFRIRSAGEVEVLGQDPATASEDWRARTGVVLQSWRDHPRWTPRRLLTQLGEYYRPYATPDRQRPHDIDDLLETVGLSQLADQKINTLSGGQRRRLDVAIGIVGRPELLFLDEPTAGFDPQARREFHELIRRLSQVDRTTILLTTHDLDEAERLATRVLVLAGGRIVADDTVSGLADRVEGETEVRWRQGGTAYTERVPDGTAFVRELFARSGEEVHDLEVRRSSLEDAYLALVQEHEAGHEDAAARLFSATTAEVEP
ncbi:ABC transporter ATP-binding protein [Nocardioides sp. HM23]|uniref:ABC transporter ATP-binding protein n=1 Tax=Nocardioides bizhenqiangii TaxID=3095076 RepID=UPI002ACA4EB7|nr:ABC transporter ATP-binding protein [Nocardioides sp. HM23]MDZ5623265.1 ABC transporter ATP-binding protein [Nocardioides sp. HM23]